MAEVTSDLFDERMGGCPCDGGSVSGGGLLGDATANGSYTYPTVLHKINGFSTGLMIVCIVLLAAQLFLPVAYSEGISVYSLVLRWVLAISFVTSIGTEIALGSQGQKGSVSATGEAAAAAIGAPIEAVGNAPSGIGAAAAGTTAV